MRNQVTSNPKILETLLNLYLFEAVSFLSRFNIWNPLLRIGWASAKNIRHESIAYHQNVHIPIRQIFQAIYINVLFDILLVEDCGKHTKQNAKFMFGGQQHWHQLAPSHLIRQNAGGTGQFYSCIASIFSSILYLSTNGTVRNVNPGLINPWVVLLGGSISVAIYHYLKKHN